MNSGSLKIDRSWTLFLDRDGVINKRLAGDYVKKWEEFRFLPGVLQALEILSGVFGRIIVVSNQQGVGKGLMTPEDVNEVHGRMKQEIENGKGRIDQVYFSPFLEEEKTEYRKPNPGMAFQARKDFPEIDFSKSVMAGDSGSDMIFGKKLGMYTVFISGDAAEIAKNRSNIDHVFPDLISLAKAVKKSG